MHHNDICCVEEEEEEEEKEAKGKEKNERAKISRAVKVKETLKRKRGLCSRKRVERGLNEVQ